MKLFKIPLFPLRVATISLIIVISIILFNRHSGLDKLVRKMFTPSLSTVDREWFLELNKNYVLCGHQENQNLTFHSRKQLENYLQNHPEYRLKTTHVYSFIYINRIFTLCPSCQNNQFLGIRDSKVVVIRGTPLKPGPVLESTHISLDKLPKLELEDLQKGIPLQNEREKLQIIEGLRGLGTN